jgi:hypothetical protein
MRRKPRRLRKPYPPTADIPNVGLTLFNADWARSYALARAKVIETLAVGSKRKTALVYPTCAKLGVDPHK